MYNRKTRSILCHNPKLSMAIKRSNQGGLNDTIKAIAEELEVKPAILKKAIKLAHKAEFGKEKQDHETLETILETVGKTL